MTLLSDRRPARGPVEVPASEEAFALVAAVSAMVAGGIHLAVVPQHWASSWVISAFFLVLGLAQLGLAAAFRWRLAAQVLAGAIVAHLGVIALYVASRTVDLPFVPPHDVGHEVDHLPVVGGVGNGVPVYPGSRIEPVGALDAACLVAELVLIAMMAALLPPRWRNALTSVMVLLALGALVARVSGVLG